MFGFLVGRLGFTLPEAYDMTWSEFELRAYGHRQNEAFTARMFREVAYNALVGPHADPKKLPKSKQAYWKLPGDKVSRVSGRMVDAFKAAMKDYLNKRRNAG